MSKSISRRSVTAALAAIPAAVAMGAPAAATTDEPDAELRRLWAQYLDQKQAFEARLAATWPVQDVYDAARPESVAVWEWSPRGKGRQLWQELDLDRLHDAWNAEDVRMRETIAAIQDTAAEGPFGFGVKLAALVAGFQEEDYRDAIESVFADINRITGETFATPKFPQKGDEGGGNV